MNRTATLSKRLVAIAVILAAAAIPPAAVRAQGVHVEARAWAANVVVPQSRMASLSADHTRAAGSAAHRVEVTSVSVTVSILDQAASTTIDVSMRNLTAARQEAELLVPVPDGAAVKGFSFQGAAAEPTAELLPKDKAVATYKSIVASMRDPALLEFAGYNVIRSSVFPVDPHGTQKVRLIYEQLLPADGDRVDYLLPRTEAIDYKVPWDVTLSIQSKRPISTVYSSSHTVAITRVKANAVTAKLAAATMAEPGPLQLSYLLESADGVTASLFAYPDTKVDGGYFLLLAGLPALPARDGRGDDGPTIKREITLVIDRSGSMAGEKIQQVKDAALQVVSGLADGEAFNIIDYSDSINSFASAPVVKDKTNAEDARHYIRKISAAGGTNIHDVLLEALRPKPLADTLPIVLFLTDGVPTVGVRDEVAIREAAIKANVHNRRIFTFGVGYDVNSPLLTHLARNSRAMSTFVLPKEDVEAKVSQVYRRLYGPVLASPKLEIFDDGKPTTARVRDVLPAAGEIPDLFDGDQVVLLGKYTGDKPIEFRLTGRYGAKSRTFAFKFNLDKSTTRNNFVPRLWASRKIAMLVDEIRQAGAADSGPASAIRPIRPATTDPKMKELVDEIVRLSLEFGVLTEYTAFLAKEGTDLRERDRIVTATNGNLVSRAQRTRDGVGSVNQDYNTNGMMAQAQGNRRNGFQDANMNRVQVTRVQQMNDRAFFQQDAGAGTAGAARNSRWVDGNVLNGKRQEPDRVVKIGTPEFDVLLDQLIAQNRQGVIAMGGEILIQLDGKNVLITGE